ncbi:hypothetical protein CBL_10070 [Carabus blaptoides fortunei]
MMYRDNNIEALITCRSVLPYLKNDLTLLSSENYGRDFVQHVHTRINTLPSRIRVSRGARRNQREVQCRGGCQATETAAHVIQCCWRTHGGRVLRHNAVADRFTSELQAKGWTVVSEPHIQTTMGLRKPDIVASREQKGLVLDVQIVSGAQPLSQHQVKAAKYDDPDILRYVSTTMDIPPEATSFSSCTISWRSIWAAESYRDLVSLGLSARFLEGLTTRVLQGSHTNWSRFNQMTA